MNWHTAEELHLDEEKRAQSYVIHAFHSFLSLMPWFQKKMELAQLLVDAKMFEPLRTQIVVNTTKHSTKQLKVDFKVPEASSLA